MKTQRAGQTRGSDWFREREWTDSFLNAPNGIRVEAWSRLARDFDLKKLARTTQVVGLATTTVARELSFLRALQTIAVPAVDPAFPRFAPPPRLEFPLALLQETNV
jgi:hypothetical protein